MKSETCSERGPESVGGSRTSRDTRKSSLLCSPKEVEIRETREAFGFFARLGVQADHYCLLNPIYILSKPRSCLSKTPRACITWSRLVHIHKPPLQHSHWRLHFNFWGLMLCQASLCAWSHYSLNNRTTVHWSFYSALADVKENHNNLKTPDSPDCLKKKS